MSGDENLERRLEAWLEATARPMPPELLEDVVAAVPGVRPVGARAGFPSGRRWRFAIAAVAAAVAIAVGMSGAIRLPPGPGASAPAATASVAPTATEASPVTATPSASAQLGEWHRNNYDAGEEQLTCRESEQTWTCYYEIPDGSGRFSGDDVSASWICPEWFPATICENVVSVYHGDAVYSFADAGTSGPSLTVSQDYVVTSVDGQEILQLAWVDQNVCPWYRTFEAALAADHACVFAPGSGPPSPG